MKLYLSSYKLGDEAEKLFDLAPEDNKRLAYMSNAMDVGSRVQARGSREQEDMSDLKKLGFEVEQVDLREYFGKSEKLYEDMSQFGAVWVCGGNTFVLRQAMYLSGFDKIICDKLKATNMLYGGYSAGVCVLSPTLDGLHLVDDPDAKPYGDDIDTIWEGLGLIDYSIAPHYQSDHPESEDVEKEVEYCRQKGIPCKPLRDGEVIILVNE